MLLFPNTISLTLLQRLAPDLLKMGGKKEGKIIVSHSAKF